MQLQVLTVLAHPGAKLALRNQILCGNLREAFAMAEDDVDPRNAAAGSTDDARSMTAQLCGDLMLALDRGEEAEETYRLAVKLAGGAQRGSVRVVSCRCTGFLNLYRQRYAVAQACFARLAVDDAATPAQRVEAHCAIAVAHEGQGEHALAAQALDTAGELACDAQDSDLMMLVSLMRAELVTACEVRAHEALQDQLFWRPLAGGPPIGDPDKQPLAIVDICLTAHGHHALVSQRLNHLRNLLRATKGETGLQTALAEYLATLRAAGLGPLEMQGRIDTALVALTQRQHDFARSLIEPLLARDTYVQRRWSMELAFCQAKLSQFSGRVEEAMKHYQRYALESMACVRPAARAVATELTPGHTTSAEIRDDIEMRLPAKYRRAYRYLQSHLGCPDLTVREIADDMGVTERTLQWAFKTNLGMSPGEVVQRCRVERIRADLLRDDAQGVNEIASRWGIRNRSTLIASYRKYFRETPTQTLARRGGPGCHEVTARHNGVAG